jgi:hypothetical protein
VVATLYWKSRAGALLPFEVLNNAPPLVYLAQHVHMPYNTKSISRSITCKIDTVLKAEKTGAILVDAADYAEDDNAASNTLEAVDCHDTEHASQLNRYHGCLR